MTTGYSGRPLTAKLGVRDGSRTLVTGAPDDFTLDAPHHTRAGSGPYDLVLLFCPSVAVLRRRFVPSLERTVPAGAVWVAWPKRSSGVPTDLTEDVIRDELLPLGVVDVKVCAISDVWSGLKLVRRLSNR